MISAGLPRRSVIESSIHWHARAITGRNYRHRPAVSEAADDVLARPDAADNLWNVASEVNSKRR